MIAAVNECGDPLGRPIKPTERKCRGCGVVLPKTDYVNWGVLGHSRYCPRCLHIKSVETGEKVRSKLKGLKLRVHVSPWNKPSIKPCYFCRTTSPHVPRTWYWNLDIVTCDACKAKLDDATKSFRGRKQ